MKWLKTLGTVLACAGAAAFLWFIWPTPFEYTRKAPNVWRVHRFTGVKEQATGEGWMTEGRIARKMQVAEGKVEARVDAVYEQEASKVIIKTIGSYTASRVDFLNLSNIPFEINKISVEYRDEKGAWIARDDVPIKDSQMIPASSERAITIYDENHSFPSEIYDFKKFTQILTVEVSSNGVVMHGPFVVSASRNFTLGLNAPSFYDRLVPRKE